MTTTTKYLLIGGAALAVTAIVVYKMEAAKAAAQKPTGLSGVLSGLKQVYDSSKGFSFRTAPSAPTKLEGGGLPYGTRSTSDGTAAVSDATGVRGTHAWLPAQASYLDPEQAALTGIYS